MSSQWPVSCLFIAASHGEEKWTATTLQLLFSSFLEVCLFVLFVSPLEEFLHLLTLSVKQIITKTVTKWRVLVSVHVHIISKLVFCLQELVP